MRQKKDYGLKNFFIEIGRSPKQTIIFCGNKSSICKAKNPEQHARSKYIDIRGKLKNSINFPIPILKKCLKKN